MTTASKDCTPKANGRQNRKGLRKSPPQPQPTEPAKEVTAFAPDFKDFKNLTTPELIRILHEEHHHYLSCMRQGLKHARRAGAALANLKARLKHGSWGAWLKQHFKGSA